MLSDCCPVCLSVLPVTLVYCGQTVGWIKLKLGMVVGLGPGHTVLDGGPNYAPTQKKEAGHNIPPPNFGPCIVAKRLDGSRCHLVGGRPQPRSQPTLCYMGTQLP